MLSKDHKFSKYCKPPEMIPHAEYEVNLFGRDKTERKELNNKNRNYFDKRLKMSKDPTTKSFENLMSL